MSWPFETSEPLVTPERFSEFQRRQRGLSPEDWALPPTLVATFQRSAFDRLLERAGVAIESVDHTRRPVRAVGAVDGVPVTLMRLGVGAPAAALALEESIPRGVRNVLVVGAAGSLQPHLPLGSVVIVDGAAREDGTSHHYLPAGEVVTADAALCSLLEQCAAARGVATGRGRAWTIDAPYRETVGAIRRHRAAGVAVVEMEAAAIFAVAQVRGVRAALIVAISDELFGEQWHLGFEHRGYQDTLIRSADVALDASARLH